MSGNCVEIGDYERPGQIGIRDSKNPDGARLFVTPDKYAAFIDSLKDGEISRP
jgi:hypothetical protein